MVGDGRARGGLRGATLALGCCLGALRVPGLLPAQPAQLPIVLPRGMPRAVYSLAGLAGVRNFVLLTWTPEDLAACADLNLPCASVQHLLVEPLQGGQGAPGGRGKLRACARPAPRPACWPRQQCGTLGLAPALSSIHLWGCRGARTSWCYLPGAGAATASAMGLLASMRGIRS